MKFIINLRIFVQEPKSRSPRFGDSGFRLVTHCVIVKRVHDRNTSPLQIGTADREIGRDRGRGVWGPQCNVARWGSLCSLALTRAFKTTSSMSGPPPLQIIYWLIRVVQSLSFVKYGVAGSKLTAVVAFGGQLWSDE